MLYLMISNGADCQRMVRSTTGVNSFTHHRELCFDRPVLVFAKLLNLSKDQNKKLRIDISDLK